MTLARLQKAKRLLDIHQDLQRLEEARIAGLKARQTELLTLQEELFGMLNSDSGGLLMPSIVRRVKTLSEEQLRIASELERRARALQRLASRTKHAERISRTYAQQHDRAQAEKELRDIIERLARPKDASLP